MTFIKCVLMDGIMKNIEYVDKAKEGADVRSLFFVDY